MFSIVCHGRCVVMLFQFFFLCRLRPLTYGINIIPLAGAFLQGTANETEKFNISAPKTKSNEETGTKKKKIIYRFRIHSISMVCVCVCLLLCTMVFRAK